MIGGRAGRGKVRWPLWVALLVAFLLHQDLWFWNDAQIVLGLPVGLTYHVLYCLAVSAMMAILLRIYWPKVDTGSKADEGPLA